MSSIPSREELLFTSAVALKGTARQAFLDEACASERDLRLAVESLLRAHDAAGEFLEPAVSPAPAADEIPDLRLGRYEVVRKLGEGGCGVVYEAEQREPVQRRVALKIIKPGMDTKVVITRFEAERQALALMDHPNIAKVFDAGVTENGRPYFVMELVRGRRITDYCDENGLSLAERLALFTHVCQALQHAHQKGVIHRDLKPSNILVALRDDTPVPVVIDFGIAKATEGNLTGDNSFTDFGHFIGTPAYMSPEQAEGGGSGVDTRSDIYSLGALLYELVSGRPPFEPQPLIQAGVDEIRRVIREVDPPKPSVRLAALAATESGAIAQRRDTSPMQLCAKLRGDLDSVIMKALEKERGRRYETAAAFASDVARHLENLPVLARPQSGVYRLRKLVARHKVATATIGGIAAVVMIGGGFVAVEYVREKAALRRAVTAEEAHRHAQQEADAALARATEAEKIQARLALQAETARRSEAQQRSFAEISRANETALRARAEDAALRSEALRSEPAERVPSKGPVAPPASDRSDAPTTETVADNALRPRGADTIQIVRVAPKRVTAGVSIPISVWVKYSLVSRPDARVTLGFNTMGPNAYPIATSKLIDGPSGEIELVVTTVPVQWPGGKEFSLLVNIAPDPRPPGAQNLAWAIYPLELQ